VSSTLYRKLKKFAKTKLARKLARKRKLEQKDKPKTCLSPFFVIGQNVFDWYYKLKLQLTTILNNVIQNLLENSLEKRDNQSTCLKPLLINNLHLDTTGHSIDDLNFDTTFLPFDTR
jgi:hypothetical protein